MIPVRARRLAAVARGRVLAGDRERLITGVGIDSRTVEPGSCFFAIRGDRHDGHDFVTAAVNAGATAVVVHRLIDLPISPGAPVTVVSVPDTTTALQALAAHVRELSGATVVGITGSVGKTTTKAFAASLLAPRWRVRASRGNFNNHWGLPLSLLTLEEGDQVMVTEMAMSHAGEIAHLARIAAPRIGLITNIAPAHMENFADLDAVAAAKAELAEALPRDGTLLVNADDERTAAMATRFRHRVSEVLTYGRAGDADVVAHRPRPTAEGWRLGLELRDGSRTDVELRVGGEHSLANFMAAAALAHRLEVPATTIADRAASLALPPMRGERRMLPNGVTMIDDSYNASPLAMMRSMDLLAEQPASDRRIVVAGDMLELGDWTAESHREVGSHAASLDLDLLVAVGQYAEQMAEGAAEAGLAEARIRVFATAHQAADAVARLVGAGDVVLVKGSRRLQMEHVVAALEAAAGGERREAAEG